MRETMTVFDFTPKARSEVISEDERIGRATALYDEAIAEMEKRREELVILANRLKSTSAEAKKILVRLSDTIAF